MVDEICTMLERHVIEAANSLIDLRRISSIDHSRAWQWFAYAFNPLNRTDNVADMIAENAVRNCREMELYQ